jgi:SAM-dependent methyltransferase
MKKQLGRKLAHWLFRIREYNDSRIKAYASNINGKTILEIGSGKMVGGKYVYSAKDYFNASNTFIQTDLMAEYGHQCLDVLNMNEVEEYDIIICMNVLEHVYDYGKAIKNMERALRRNGELVVFVPMYYPLHDEPHDYWRFTEHALKRMFDDFEILDFSWKGLREFPVAYFISMKK